MLRISGMTVPLPYKRPMDGLAACPKKKIPVSRLTATDSASGGCSEAKKHSSAIPLVSLSHPSALRDVSTHAIAESGVVHCFLRP